MARGPASGLTIVDLERNIDNHLDRASTSFEIEYPLENWQVTDTELQILAQEYRSAGWKTAEIYIGWNGDHAKQTGHREIRVRLSK
jgi:hypothetical protein